MNLFTRLADWWAARKRAIDIAILWPACKRNALSLNTAKAAFTIHAFSDPAWMRLGEEEILRRVRELE